MFRGLLRKLIVGAIATPLAAVPVSVTLQAVRAQAKAADVPAAQKTDAEKQDAKDADKKPDKKKGDAKKPADPRGRLPAQYTKVVNEEQREKIYAIQKDYNDRIAQLEDQVKSLQAKRDADVEAVLTPDQRAQVARLRDEAEATKKKKSDDKKGKKAADKKIDKKAEK